MRSVALIGLAVAGASALAGGAATLVSGSTQDVRILSDPPGAALTVGDREAATPAVLSLSRDQDYDVVLRKPGYVVARRKLLQHRNPWLDGNVLSFGSLGVAIDQFSGAAYQFPEPTLFVSLIRQPVDPAGRRVRILHPRAGGGRGGGTRHRPRPLGLTPPPAVN